MCKPLFVSIYGDGALLDATTVDPSSLRHDNEPDENGDIQPTAVLALHGVPKAIRVRAVDYCRRDNMGAEPYTDGYEAMECVAVAASTEVLECGCPWSHDERDWTRYPRSLAPPSPKLLVSSSCRFISTGFYHTREMNMRRIKPSQNDHQWPRHAVPSVECRKRDLVVRIADWTKDKECPAFDVEVYIGGVYDWTESQTFSYKHEAVAFASQQIAKLL